MYWVRNVNVDIKGRLRDILLDIIEAKYQEQYDIIDKDVPLEIQHREGVIRHRLELLGFEKRIDINLGITHLIFPTGMILYDYNNGILEKIKIYTKNEII